MNTVKIGEIEVAFTVNAATPYIYRKMFNEDLLVKMQKLTAENPDTECLYNLAYCMAKQANPNILPMEEWLAQFDLTEFYNALPTFLEAWSNDTKQTSKPKKHQGQ